MSGTSPSLPETPSETSMPAHSSKPAPWGLLTLLLFGSALAAIAWKATRPPAAPVATAPRPPAAPGLRNLGQAFIAPQPPIEEFDAPAGVQPDGTPLSSAEPTAEPEASPTPPTTPASGPAAAPQETETIASAVPWLDMTPIAHPLVAYITAADHAAWQLNPELMEWWKPIPFEPGKNSQLRAQGPFCELNGAARFVPPWPAGTLLRLVGLRPSLRVHVGQGDAPGLMLFYSDEGWRAYLTERTPDGPLPRPTALLADDGGLVRSAVLQGEEVPWDLWWSGEELRLLSGELTLLSLPLRSPPTEVLLQGQVMLRGAGLRPIEPLPPRDPFGPIEQLSVEPTGFGAAPPLAAWTWHEERLGEGCEQLTLSDGAIELHAQQATKPGWTATRIPGIGLREVVLRIDDVGPGIGIAQARSPTQGTQLFRWTRERRTQQLTLVADHFGNNEAERELNFEREGGALVPAGPHWVRILSGCDWSRAWVSQDGRHWAHVPARVAAGGEFLLLAQMSGKPEARVRVAGAEVRPLALLNSLADEPTLRRLVAADIAGPAPLNREQAEESCRAGLDDDLWARTWALHALARGLDPEWQAHLTTLLDATERSGLSLEARRATLLEAALLLRPEHAWMLRPWFSRLGRDAFATSGAAPYSYVLQASLAARVPMDSWAPEEAIWVELARREALDLVERGDWTEAYRFAQQLRHHRQDQRIRLVPWLETVARQHAPGLAQFVRPLPTRWLSPAVVNLDKDTFNVVAELQSLLTTDGHTDVARVVASAEEGEGLTTHPEDSRLLTTLGAMVGQAAESHPTLREALRTEADSVARLRLNEALRRGDFARVASLSRLFPGTAAAAEAHVWLGDLALAEGRFDRAAAEYACAERDDSLIGARRAARRELATSLAGAAVDESPAAAVAGNSDPLAAEIASSLGSARASRSPGPPPGAGKLARRATIDTIEQSQAARRYAGVDDRLHPQAHWDFAPFDWAGRQLAAALAGEQLLVSDRFQLRCYRRDSGAPAWETPRPEIAPKPRPTDSPTLAGSASIDWPLAAMRPLVVGQQVLVRHLHPDGPALHAYALADGVEQWRRSVPQGFWASDPVVVDGRVVAIAARKSVEISGYQLTLAALRPHDGELLEERPLIAVRDSWSGRRVCEVAPVDDGLLVSLAGAVLHASWDEGARWVRRDECLPQEEGVQWMRDAWAPPVVAGEHAFIKQPGVAAIECVRRRTGAQQWRRLAPEVRGVVGHVPGELIVFEDDALAAWDAETGETRWRRFFGDADRGAFGGAFLDGAGRLLCIVHQPVVAGQGGRYPTLRWLDATTGEPLAEDVRFEDDCDEAPRWMPLVCDGARLWLALGRGDLAPFRELAILEP